MHLATVGAAYQAQLIRYDELAFPAEWGGPATLRFDVESHEEAAPDTGGREPLRLGVDVDLAEVLPLIRALAGQFALAGGAS